MALDEIIRLSDGSFLDKKAILAGHEVWEEYKVGHEEDGLVDLENKVLYRRVHLWRRDENDERIRVWGIWDRTELSESQVEALKKKSLFF